MSTKITIGRVDVTEHVAAMFSLAMNSRGYDDEPMYSDEDLEGMLLVAHLAGIEIPAGFDLASVPDAPGRPERPAQQYHGSDGVLITRSHSEQEVLWSAYGEAEGRWYEARQALISATRARLLEQVAAKARAMAEGERRGSAVPGPARR